MYIHITNVYFIVYIVSKGFNAIQDIFHRRIACGWWSEMIKSKINVQDAWLQDCKLGLSLLDCYWLVGKECRRLVGNRFGDW